VDMVERERISEIVAVEENMIAEIAKTKVGFLKHI